MKKLIALILALMMILTLAACGGGNGKSPAKKDLTTFEMTVAPDGVEEPAKATIGYPDNFTKKETDWSVILTDESKDVQIEVFFTNDYNCYEVNRDDAKENAFFYEAGKYGDFDGYAMLSDEASAELEVNVYLACVAEMDDVYLTFRISSASRDLDADPKALYELEEVRDVLNSAVYTAPAA